jgi:hypothetical protein
MSKQSDRIIRQEISDQSQLTDVNSGGAKLTDAELEAVSGGVQAKNDMLKGIIQHFRV